MINAASDNSAYNQKRYRLVGMVIFFIASATLLIRLLVSVLPLNNSQLISLIFSFTVQIGILVLSVGAILIFGNKKHYSYGLKTLIKQSNFKKTKWFNYALALPMGIIWLFVTIGVSGVWAALVRSTGYTSPPSEPLPDVFSPSGFVLEVLLIAILPAFCEEFAMRGVFFTTMKKSYRTVFLYLIMSVAFGLFHQNVMQVFYTALFGAVAVFLLLKTKSVWPCIILHFASNFTSVYINYASKYLWFGGRTINGIFGGGLMTVGGVLVLYSVIVGVFAGLMVAYHFLNKGRNRRHETQFYPAVLAVNQQSKPNAEQQIFGADLTYTALNTAPPTVSPMIPPTVVTGENTEAEVKQPLYKPTLRDNAFYIGAGIVATLSTAFTFVWGFIN